MKNFIKIASIAMGMTLASSLPSHAGEFCVYMADAGELAMQARQGGVSEEEIRHVAQMSSQGMREAMFVWEIVIDGAYNEDLQETQKDKEIIINLYREYVYQVCMSSDMAYF